MLTTGWVSRSEQSTTIRFETIAALRSSSSWTTSFSESSWIAFSTIETAPITIFCARRDHRLGLLAAKHRLGDLLGISEVGQAAFVDGDAGAGDALLQLALELLADHLGVAAQRHSP